MRNKAIQQDVQCYHCGENCVTENIRDEEKIFCCEGCKLVYRIINKSELCNYYDLNKHPGNSQRIKVRENKFAFLDNDKVLEQIISFRDEEQSQVHFYLPQMHCSSCLYLLENLHKLAKGIIASKVNFVQKEITVTFSNKESSLRKVAELLTGIGYEPYISLNDLGKKPAAVNKSLVYQLGIAGFCFGNIMLMSFPEYLGIDASEQGLRQIFRWLNLLLALPVFFYSALPFYQSSIKSLKHRFLSIDAPISLAIFITFGRSVYEVITGTGGGYFDSMSGIVFFMLAGRLLQDKVYRHLSFERDYTSYFPIAVSVLKENNETAVILPDLKPGDTILIHNEELIPADGIITKGRAYIDYSFVTGESTPVLKEVGELIYAGGKQTGGNVEILLVKEVAQSYLTSLWNNTRRSSADSEKNNHSFVHALSRYFTLVLMLLVTVTAVYWYVNDSTKIWPAITAMMIIACPCALLLSNTFTNGNIIRILGRNHFYLRNSQGIESIAGITHIVFDKTGTLTSVSDQHIEYLGKPLTKKMRQEVITIAACSSHPLSRALAKQFGKRTGMIVDGFSETTGQGIEGFVNGELIKLGSYHFVTGNKRHLEGTAVFVSIEDELMGCFQFSNNYRKSLGSLVKKLKQRYRLSVLSGDNAAEKDNLEKIFGKDVSILFHQKPENKRDYIASLQMQGEKVMMIGDGLNDGVAFQQSDVGVAVSEQTNNFTPASDAIIKAKQLSKLPKFIRLCRANKRIIIASFALSIVYNIAGLWFAMQGTLSPLIAAILMPMSSFSIMLITFGSSNVVAKWMRL